MKGDEGERGGEDSTSVEDFLSETKHLSGLSSLSSSPLVRINHMARLIWNILTGIREVRRQDITASGWSWSVLKPRTFCNVDKMISDLQWTNFSHFLYLRWLVKKKGGSCNCRVRWIRKETLQRVFMFQKTLCYTDRTLLGFLYYLCDLGT